MSEDKTPIKKKILWIEDDVMIGTILGNKILAAGYDLIHIIDGEEALNYLKESTPNLIVIDILLPGIDGLSVIKKLHDDARLSKIPIIILSNISTQADIDLAKSLGVKKFLVKPATSLEEIMVEVLAWCK